MSKSKLRRRYEETQRHIDLDPVQQEARKLHFELFQEEYDFYYDSKVEAEERRKGINPMCIDYVQSTNLKRQKLGFRPFEVVGKNEDTFSWVLKLMKEGNIEIIKNALAMKS